MIKDLKELEKLLKLCRKQGVTEIKLQDVELKLGDLPQAQSQSQEPDQEAQDAWLGLPPGFPSEEQLKYYSAGGAPLEE